MSARDLKVSVALCCYNGAQFIEEQLQSILDQSRPPDEVIVCDDGSTDGTVEIVQRFAERYPQVVKFERNPQNLRLDANFEKAFRLATGDVIFASDQDDVWLANRIAIMLEPFATRSEVGLVYSDAFLADSNLRPTGRTLYGLRKQYHIGRVRTANEVIQGVEVRGSQTAFRASLRSCTLPLPRNGGWNFDYWTVFIASAVTTVVPIGIPLMYYRRHQTNLSPLETGLLRDYRSGLRPTSSSTAHYASDRQKWETALERLTEIAADPSSPFAGSRQLKDYRRCCEDRLELARVREQVKRESRPRRLVPALRTLLRGDYHRFCRGTKTFAKDLLVV